MPYAGRRHHAHAGCGTVLLRVTPYLHTYWHLQRITVRYAWNTYMTAPAMSSTELRSMFNNSVQNQQWAEQLAS